MSKSYNKGRDDAAKDSERDKDVLSDISDLITGTGYKANDAKDPDSYKRGWDDQKKSKDK